MNDWASLDRRRVRAVKEVVDRAVAEAVKGLGFTAQTCNVSYSSYNGTVNYKVVLITKGKEGAVLNANAVGGWKVGDVARDREGKTWEIVGFTSKGNIKIKRSDGKLFRCPSTYLLPKEA